MIDADKLHEDVARAICCPDKCKTPKNCFKCAYHDLVHVIIHLVLERAAEMAESHAPTTQDMRSTEIADVCDRIATAIRSLGNIK